MFLKYNNEQPFGIKIFIPKGTKLNIMTNTFYIAVFRLQMFCWYNDDNQVLKRTLTLDCHHCTNKTYLSKKEMERARQKEKGLSNAKFSTFQYFKANTSFFLLRKEAFKLNMVMKDIIFK